MRIIIYISILTIFAGLVSCKKESKPTPTPSSNGGGNTNTNLVVNYYPNTIGYQWVYKYSYYEQVSNNNSVTIYTATDTYTVKVISDTTLPNGCKGKKWALIFANTSNNRIHLAYSDTINNLFKIFDVPDINTVYITGAFNYPLSGTPKTWINNGMLLQDTSKVIGQEIFNGTSVIKITRGNIQTGGSYNYKINNKGLAYSLYELIDVVNTQITYTSYENKLISTNF